ncbi:MAG: bifunctional diaminohydroxyphosphoribosylaminopyrimidine deaminase/5-amino-6-(5-phosphoribosylamino)uracil reductase RibD [Deltaproteobacteria bacterium]|nr:bifunctional diaminohydroxyphosphoribosylaminopyrimidine deaminase/5-amino-6-(5-phosphoribosylamino)uracil reductase RibD [Deltaproteobacteria bacterium]
MSGLDDPWMARAVEIAARGTRAVRPNPKVGCVLVRDGRVVGEGFHAVCGGPHAEVEALRQAGASARGATAYVTLEPCNHHGRTGPCSDALIAAGVARVVAAVRDPNPSAQGGLARLAAAGVEVLCGLGADAARAVAEVFLTNVVHGRPLVQLKLAASADGRVAAADGTSRWVTGPAARAEVARMRGEADAVLVGSGTALADNPRLDLRHAPDAGPLPLRVVFDRRGRLADVDPAALHLGDAAHQATHIVTARADGWLRWIDRGAQVSVQGAQGDWTRAALAGLLRAGVCHLLCEGGPILAAGMLRAGVVDRIELFVAPKALGAGPGAIADLGVAGIDGALGWRWCQAQMCGDDVWLTGRFTKE